MELLQDVRYALRILAKRSVFTAVAVLTLGLGIGANTAIFSVLHTVLLEPLPFPEPERLVQVWESRVEQGWDRAGMNPANFFDFRAENRTFEDLTAMWSRSLNLTGLGYPERVDGAAISAGFFRVLGVEPVLGRTMSPGEDEPGGGNDVVLLSNEFWHRRFGADPGLLGSTLTLDGRGLEVIGILPPGEPWLDEADVFVPLVRDPEARRIGFYLRVIGRLKPGVSAETALADLAAIARRLEQQYPEAAKGIGVGLGPSSDWIANERLRRALWILMGAMGLLLLIACVNLANMLLATGTDRLRETAVRAALGAGRRRIARQSLVESLVLGLFGAAAGLVLALALLQVAKTFDPGGIPRLGEAGLNVQVLAFTTLAGLGTGVLAGFISVLQLRHSDLGAALRQGDRSQAGSRGQKRVHGALVAVEVAISLVLVVGAGLLLRSFDDLMRIDRGFRTENRMMVAVDMPGSYDTERRNEVRDRFLERVSGISSVRSAAAVSGRPLARGSTGMGIVAAGPSDEEADVPWASWRLVTGGYFETLGLPLLRGRTFDERDRVGEPWRVIVSQHLAELLWPGENPVGRTAVLWKGQAEREAEVVGVVGDMLERGLERGPTLAVYLPYYGGTWSPVHFVIETTASPTALVPTLRSLLAEIDPSLPISDVRSLDEMVGESVATRRFTTILVTIFAGVALLLALVGIYGVQAYSVSRRTAEIGVRTAMGARPSELVRLVLRQGMGPAGLGIALGLAGAFGLSRLMTGLLFGVTPSDPKTYLGAAFVLGAAAVLSCYVPALRALRVDPVEALREE